MREIDPKKQNLEKEVIELPDLWGIEGAFDREIYNVVSRLQHSTMSEAVPRSELTQFHPIIRRERSFQRQSHRRPANRRQNHGGEEKSGGHRFHFCVGWKEWKKKKGKWSGIETVTLTLMEYENKKQRGAEIGGAVVAVLHDRDSRERDKERESVLCSNLNEPDSCCWLQVSFTYTIIMDYVNLLLFIVDKYKHLLQRLIHLL